VLALRGRVQASGVRAPRRRRLSPKLLLRHQGGRRARPVGVAHGGARPARGRAGRDDPTTARAPPPGTTRNPPRPRGRRTLIRPRRTNATAERRRNKTTTTPRLPSKRVLSSSSRRARRRTSLQRSRTGTTSTGGCGTRTSSGRRWA
jgi:hypothetical protein